MNKLTVAILFGGCSEEHDISIKSASEIAKNIDTDKYEPIYIGITKKGVWKRCTKPCAEWEEQLCMSTVISPDRDIHGIIYYDKDGNCRTQWIDVIFPVMHGKMGEDGSIQGLLELSGIPYVGCDIESSAICMDKALAYLVVQAAGVLTPRFHICSNGVAPILESTDYPVFVKPARSGSSFGISKVYNSEELKKAITKAQQYDKKVLIEETITGCEMGCAVMGNGDNLVVGEVDQILLSRGFFQIHQETAPEQGSENSQIVVPANISMELSKSVKDTAKVIYQALGCRGLARVDMFVKEDGQVVLNEVNTLPGCTCYSRFPRMMKAANIPMSKVIDTVIALAQEEK